MLTAEEQWRIIQEEERKTGRGTRKKKTLVEQLKDMGGFGHVPDSEQAIREDLERPDSRPPIQYSNESISQCEASFGESSFWESRKRLFNSWVFQAKRSSSWMHEKDLSLFFRFALHRPIMDERSFQATLRAMNMQLEMPMGDVRRPHTRPIGRSRQLMFGIDVDPNTNVHVSSKFRHILPKGAAENMDRVREEASKMAQEDEEDMQQLTRRQLWTVYEHVQNGSVPLETATWHYRDTFNSQDMSDETLVVCLQQFGIPTEQIPTNERNARRGSAHCPFPNGVESCREKIEEIAVPDAKERNIINELVNYIGLYRDGVLQDHEVIPMIQHCLHGLELGVNAISDILTDLDKDEETAAVLMWEDACYDDNTSSSEEENEELENPFRAVNVPYSHVNEGKDHDAAAASVVDESKSHDGSATEDTDCRDDIKDNEPERLEAMSIDRPPMSPTATPPSKRPTSSHVNEADNRAQPPGTSRPKPASHASATVESGSQAGVESDREPPSDQANVGRRRASSSENGMTTGIWGLLMPTKEARTIAHKLKLPQDTIDEQVRSISPRRTKRRRASYAKTIVTFSKSKRKASMALHGDTPPKSPKHGDHSDLFARDGENQETFALSHFDRDEIRSKDMCMRCLRLPCVCVNGSTPRSRSEPDETIPITPPNGNPSFAAPKAKFTDRTRPEAPKRSVTLLGYLARVLDDDDVLASIKQLERQFPADTSVANAKVILYHMQQGLLAGEELDAPENDDLEAFRILRGLVESSRALAEYSGKLYCDATGENASTTRIDCCQDGAGKGPDTASSLLDSSPGHEYVPAPPSNPAASATTFPEIQPNIANGSVFRANNTPPAKYISPYLPTPASDPSIPPLESSSDIENVIQSSPFQAGTFPDSSAGGHSSRANTHSVAPTGGHPSTTGGHRSTAEVLSKAPTGSPPSSTADPSEQVSDKSIDAEGDTDCDTFGATLTRQRNSSSRDAGNSEIETRPPTPRPEVGELNGNSSPISPRPGSKESSRTMNAIAQSCLKGPEFDSLPLWPAQEGLPERAGIAWTGMTPKKALDHAKEEAFSQRKSLAFYLEERRAVRTQIKKENDFANSVWSDHRFFHSSNGSSGSSGAAVTPALNKLFDKYRGTSRSQLPLLV